jgi:hypothetical protein
MMEKTWTIVDVLENALDGEVGSERAMRLSMAEVRSLREVVIAFYETWVPYPAEEDSLRVHLGGWVASSAGEGLARDLLHAALLYAHQVIVYDPVAAYFEPRRRRLRAFGPVQGVGISSEASAIHMERTGGFASHEDNLEGHRTNLAAAFTRVAALAPLIREGTVVPIPHLKLALQRQEKIWVAVRHLLADDQYLEILEHPVDHPALTQDEGTSALFLVQPRTAKDARLQNYGDAAYYLSRSIALADAAYASYLPPSGTEWAIYQQRLERLGASLRTRERLDLTVTPALVHSKLPYFKDLTSADLVAVRGNEESFDHWRSSLRTATRQITALPSAGEEFAEEAREVLSDALDEVAAEVRQATSRSAALKRNLRRTTLTVGTGAAGAVAMGSPPQTALGGVAATGMLNWLIESLLPPSLSGTKAVLAHLLPDSADQGTIEEWPKREPLGISRK